MNKVGFLGHKPSGCQWYRNEHPMKALSRAGIPTELIHINQEVDDSFQSLQFYGAYPFMVDKIIDYMKQEGKRVIYDTDDALELIEETNPFYYLVKKDIPSSRMMLDRADIVTVSTKRMAEYVSDKTKAQVTVVPNCFDSSEWTYPKPARSGIRIGFVGSSTHVSDLIPILPVIQKLQSIYPDLTFIIMGFADHGDYKRWYNEFRYVSTDAGIKDLEEFDRLLTGIRFEFVPFVPIEQYPSTLTNLSLDIGICPLKDTPFNRCRSACKTMEYTLSGALALASDLDPYQEDRNSILVGEGEWEEQLRFFIDNPQIRESAHSDHLKWTRENRNIDDKIDLLKSVHVVQ